MFFVFKGVLERTVGVSLSFMGITMVIDPISWDIIPLTEVYPTYTPFI